MTDSNGVIRFEDLEPRIYELRETKTVDGYHLIKDVYRIDLRTATGNTLTRLIVNAKEFRELPTTGTMSTLPYLAIAFPSLFTGIFVLRKKKQTK